MAMVVMGGTCVQSITAIRTTMVIIVINCLRLSAVVIYCCHGNGSDGRRVCSKYHGFTHYNQATMLVIVINCLRLFSCCYHGDGSDGRQYVQSITAIGTTISNL